MTAAKPTVREPVMVPKEDQDLLVKLGRDIGASKSRIAGMRRMIVNGIALNNVEDF